MDPKSNSQIKAYRAFTLVTAIGTELAGCVIGGLYLGKWLDAKWGTTPWLLLTGMLLGLTVGIIGIVQIARLYSKE
ncbi:MAG: hypothetical protein JWN30_2574 [Bacilli bacterium]|nr:hypothetical protein [Bacilli bacterium]